MVLEAQDKKSDDVKKGGLGAAAGRSSAGLPAADRAPNRRGRRRSGHRAATKGKEVEVPAGTVINVLMQSPLTLQVPIKQQ